MAGRRSLVLVAGLLAPLLGCKSDETNPCAEQTCSSRGFCVEDGEAYCACLVGYRPVGLSCVPLDTADPCLGIDCNGHGACRSEGEDAACDCAEGYRHLIDPVCDRTECDLLCVPIRPDDPDAGGEADARDALDVPEDAVDTATPDEASADEGSDALEVPDEAAVEDVVEPEDSGPVFPTQVAFETPSVTARTWTVPAGVTTIRVAAWGGGGGGGASRTDGEGVAGAAGGGGGFAGADLTVTPGEELTIHVGGGGSSYAEPTAVNVTIESSATPGSPGGAGHPDLPAGVGVGGTGGSVGSSGRAGGPGFVSIRYSS